jgi:hypothetical protein
MQAHKFLSVVFVFMTSAGNPALRQHACIAHSL